jgi:integrase
MRLSISATRRQVSASGNGTRCLGASGKRRKSALRFTEISKGSYVEPSKVTVESFLERWLKHIKTQVSPKIYERYSGIVKQNLTPALGSIVLSKLKATHISEAYSTALESGRRDGSGGLSPRTVGHIHRVLRQALQQALRWEELARNPADAVDPPKVDGKPMQTYDFSETAELLDQVRETPIFVPVLLTVFCGLRRGEICALRWRDVDLGAGQMSVARSLEQTKGKNGTGLRFKSPKSGKGRTVALSATIIEELRTYRAKRAEEMLRPGVGLSEG